MESSNRFKLKATSLVESIVAMAIVAICLGIALVVYVNILQADRDIPFYQAEQKVRELLWSDNEEPSQENEDFSFPTYTIHKEVDKIDGLDDAYKIKFTVQLPNGKKIYEYVVIQ